MRGALTTGLCTALIATAYASPPRRVSLHYTRAADAQSCVDPAGLARAVEAYTGPVLVAPASAEASLEAHVEAQPGGFRARIQLAAADGVARGERVLEHAGKDCRDFDAALAFVIATTIDPDLVLERVGALFEPAPPKEELLELAHPAPQAVTAPAQPKPALATPKPPPPAVHLRELTLGAGLVGSDELPSIALGPSALVRADVWRWLALGAGTRLLFPTRESPLGAGSVRMFVWGLTGLACPTWKLGSWAAALCVGADLSVLRAEASGLDVSRGGALVSVGAALRPELTWRLPNAWSLALAGWGRAAREDRLVYREDDRTETFFETPVFSFAAELTLRRAIRTRN